MVQTTSLRTHATHNRASSTLLDNAATERESLTSIIRKQFLRQRPLRLPKDGAGTSSTFFPHDHQHRPETVMYGFFSWYLHMLVNPDSYRVLFLELEALCCVTRSCDPCVYSPVRPNKSVQPTGRWSTWCADPSFGSPSNSGAPLTDGNCRLLLRLPAYWFLIHYLPYR
jgi:hypothetical protein